MSDQGNPTYPLPCPDDDARFTYGLAWDVAGVLVRHGYPSPTASGTDVVQLQQALFTFLYGGTFEQSGEVQS